MNEIRVYTINVPLYVSDLAELKLDLSPDELEHASRFVHERDAHAYIISHAYYGIPSRCSKCSK